MSLVFQVRAEIASKLADEPELVKIEFLIPKYSSFLKYIAMIYMVNTKNPTKLLQKTPSFIVKNPTRVVYQSFRRYDITYYYY